MKKLSRNKLKALILTFVALGAVFIAQTSAYACAFWIYYQPKMPKSLIKED